MQIPPGPLSFYPGDPEVFHRYSELATIRRETTQTEFCRKREYSETLVYEGALVKGHIFNFRKSNKGNRA